MIDPSQTLAAAARLRTAMTVTLVLVLGLAAAAAVSDAGSPEEMVRAVTGWSHWDGPPPSMGQQLALAAIGTAQLGYWIVLLLIARSLFARLARGEVARAAGRARLLAGALWGLLAWSLLAGALASVAATWNMPEGERTLAVGFGSPQLSLALAALLAGFLARAFALGAELWQDHRAVV